MSAGIIRAARTRYSSTMILVAGGTGTLGSAIVQRLRDDGRPVRVLTREYSRAAALAEQGADVAVGDLADRASLERAVRGATHVITTANAFVEPARGALRRTDKAGNRHLIDAARAANVTRFMFTSALIPDAFAQVDYFAAKLKTEAYLRASGLPYTILRPAAFMEIWAKIIGEPILNKGATQIFGDGRNPMNFVAVGDVAAIAVRALDDPRAHNTHVDIVGPENLTLLEVAEIFERIKGSPAQKRHVPMLAMRIAPWLVGPFNPVFARQVRLGFLAATVPQAHDPAVSQHWNVPMTRLEDWARQHYPAPS